MAEVKLKSFPVTGMACAACAASVENALNNTIGVAKAEVNYANSSVLIEFDSLDLEPLDLKATLNGLGYDMIVEDDEDIAHEKAQEQCENARKILVNHTVWSASLTVPVMVIGMFIPQLPYANWIMMTFSIPVIAYFGKRFFTGAYNQLLHKSANMDTLVALSTSIAFLFSFFNTAYPQFWLSREIEPHVYFEASSAIITFILLGKLLEEKTKSNTSSAIKKLIGLQPKTVITVSSSGAETELSIKEVKVGEVIIVKPGDKLPVDGVVINGGSFVDESMISGEPIAVKKVKGEQVYAGTINQMGSFQFRAEKVGSKTILAHIIKMVRQAQGSKAPVQNLVDKIASIFVPVVLLITISTFITWMLIGGEQAFSYALLSAVTVLVIACPCALGLATPTAIMVGVGKGAENNILVKDAESLERAHLINTLILDKTGTITEGAPKVINEIWLLEKDMLKTVLVNIESQSSHPLANAIANHFAEFKELNADVISIENIIGKGIKATLDGVDYVVGNKNLLEEKSISVPNSLLTIIDEWQKKAQTVVYFANNRELLGVFAIADPIKATSAEAIQLIKKKGIEVFMLTGDNELTAKAVSTQIGIAHYKAAAMPSQKADFIKELQAQGKIVAMVGDGINDVEALALADISIAMGKGSDIAIDVAKMTLITSDLLVISKALELSKQTVNAIKQNLFWAFVYNLVGIPIAAGALFAFNGFLLNPMIAAAAMAFSSVSVVLNSLRLNWKPLT